MIIKKGLCFILCALSVVWITECSDKKGKSTVSESGSGSSKRISSGEILYRQYCLSCHEINGKGVKGMYPPITDTDWVNGDKKRLIEIILNGQKGNLVINGETYNEEMPKADYLTDKEIADVLTYIRSNFGNNSSRISAKEVAAVRAANERL